MLNLNYTTLITAYRRYAGLPLAELRAALGWSERGGSASHRNLGGGG